MDGCHTLSHDLLAVLQCDNHPRRSLERSSGCLFLPLSLYYGIDLDSLEVLLLIYRLFTFQRHLVEKYKPEKKSNPVENHFKPSPRYRVSSIFLLRPRLFPLEPLLSITFSALDCLYFDLFCFLSLLRQLLPLSHPFPFMLPFFSALRFRRDSIRVPAYLSSTACLPPRSYNSSCTFHSLPHKPKQIRVHLETPDAIQSVIDPPQIRPFLPASRQVLENSSLTAANMDPHA